MSWNGEKKASELQTEGSELLISLSVGISNPSIDADLTEVARLKEIEIQKISLNDLRSALESEIRLDDRFMKILVVLLKVNSTAVEMGEGLIIDLDGYTIKPFFYEEKKTTLADLLKVPGNFKFLNSGLSENPGTGFRSVDERFIQMVFWTINENISNFDFDVCMLHKKVGISRMHLSRKLKILTGLSPHILIRNIRLEKAAELLLRKEGNITEIANSIGISNPSGFSRAFRGYFGVSPKNFFKQ